MVWRHGALPAFTHYIRDNPRRYCLKQKHPDLFRKVSDLVHHNLPPEFNWTGYGNRFMLDYPERQAVIVSRKATEREIAVLRDKALQQAEQGVVLVSPFISPGEKAIAQAVIAASSGAVILIKLGQFPPLYKPSGQFFDLCAAGRLLILCGCVPAPTDAVYKLSRADCLAMNAACTYIADIRSTE